MEVGLRPPEGGRGFEASLATIEAAERLGFDSVWIAEHYTPDDGWWPASPVALAAVAARTDTIRVGSSVFVTPLYDPVWLANAVAMLDVISDGRFVAGLGAGYDPVEFAAFGVPRGERVGRTIEAIDLCKRLWTEERVTFDGAFVDVEDYGIDPRPVQAPRPPVWLGAWGDYLLEQAATRADAWLPGAVADRETLAERMALYDAHREAPPDARPLLRDIVVADTDAEARRIAERRLAPKYRRYAERGHRFFEDFEGTDFAAFAEDMVIMGAPATCAAAIEGYREALGIDHLILRFAHAEMGPADVRATMETLADEVLPALS